MMGRSMQFAGAVLQTAHPALSARGKGTCVPALKEIQV